MKNLLTTLLAGSLLLSTAAFAQQYGPGDEGRRFNDGSKVVCKNVEVQRNSKDSNRILGTATDHRTGGGAEDAVGILAVAL
ncbi:MAG: hypothetical protein EOO80_09275, partial [Oxalobacteraceae bacterium]